MKGAKKESPLILAIAELREEEAVKCVEELIATNYDPLKLIAECQEGMRQVGEHYQRQQYFLSGLIMGGEIFQKVMESIRPVVEKQTYERVTGTILLGTVEGDIHDLGKNIVNTLLTCHKFTVYDLGVDIPPSEFVQKARKLQPDIIGLSGLIAHAYDSMRETVSALRQTGIKTPIIIGGSQLSDAVCKYTRADYWVDSANAGVQICKKLLDTAHKKQ
jgi:methanogenic corrinoid protein MtbC1